MTHRLWTLSLLSMTACNQVAVLEGELVLPPRPAEVGEMWVSVQAMPSTTPLEDTWAGAALEPVALTDEPLPYRFSLETEHPDRDLHVKVRFCLNRGCDFLPADLSQSADPQAEVWFSLDHPFYLMKKDPEPTRWTAEIRTVPRCAPCSAGNCAEGRCNPERQECQLESGACVLETTPEGCEAVTDRERPTWRCEVDRCSIAGCIAGTPADYCDTLPDGTRVHLCEL